MKNFKSTGWRIEHNCPQCGAPVTLEETDRLIACPYCRVSFYLFSPNALKYYLPPPEAGRPGLFYAPYWRFKGRSFSCPAFKVEERIIDTSLRAAGPDILPLSLGLKPQVLKLKYLTPQTEGRFLSLDLLVEDALKHIEERFSLGEEDSKKEALFYRAFFSETTCLIYAPFYLNDRMVIDAISDKPVGPMPKGSALAGLSLEDGPDWEVSFISAVCPQCGWDLKGGKNSIILVCENCRSAWEPVLDGLKGMEYGLVPSKEPPAFYLPFWRMKAGVEGLPLKSYADLVRAVNLPKAIQEGWEEKEFHFWSPAFRTHPVLFLQLCRNATLAQPTDQLDLDPPRTPLYGVTLPLREAAESLKLSLANMSMAKRFLFPRLPEIKTVLQDFFLVYLPFHLQGRQLINSDMRLTIGRSVLGL